MLPRLTQYITKPTNHHYILSIYDDDSRNAHVKASPVDNW